MRAEEKVQSQFYQYDPQYTEVIQISLIHIQINCSIINNA